MKLNSQENAEYKLLDAHLYWHTRRIWYNAILAICGLIGAWNFFLIDPLSTFAVAVLYGLAANAFYSTGYVLESIVIVSTDGKKNLASLRNFLFFLGTGFSALFTLVYPMVVYLYFGMDIV